MTDVKKPRVNSAAERELDKAAEQIQNFENEVKSLTLDRMNEAPKQEIEPQTKLAQSEIAKSKDIHLKPSRIIGPGQKEKFNEKFRSDWEFAKEYVHFIAENKEIIGENIEIWTKPFPGVNCEFWQVPTNKPVWGPRYLAEQIKKCTYHKMSMANHVTQADGTAQYYGSMVVDQTVNRLDAIPVSPRRSVFMGAH